MTLDDWIPTLSRDTWTPVAELRAAFEGDGGPELAPSTFGRALSKAGIERRLNGSVREVRAAPPDPDGAPSHLSTSAREWWESTVEAHDLTPEQRRMLTLAGEAWDRCTEARLEIQRDGVTTHGAQGQIVEHPAVRIERQSRTQYVSIVRALGLDKARPKEKKSALAELLSMPAR